MTTKTIQVSENGWNEYCIDIIDDETGDCEADSHFEGKNARAKAEKRANELTKLLGVDWESNY